ncbi:EamA family transporter [Candidatus Woesearchaeota archaeon]|nr:EamA family transporter [Candidatus Woesearchaeota archaeon]
MNWLIFTIMSAILMGFAGIMQKFLLKKEHSLSLIFLMYFFGFLFLIPLNIINPPNLFEMPMFLILMRSLVVTTGLLFFTKALHHSDISIMAPIRNLSPIFLILISFVFLGERLSLKEYIGVGILIFGAYYLTIEHGQGFKEQVKRIFSSKYFLFAFFAIFIISFAPPIEKIIFTKYSLEIYNYLFVSYFFSLVFLFIMYVSHKFPINELVKSARTGAFPLSLFAIVDLTSIYFIISAIAIPASKVSLIIPIRRFSTTIELVVGGKLFKETKLMHRSFACIIMILGVFLILV